MRDILHLLSGVSLLAVTCSGTALAQSTPSPSLPPPPQPRDTSPAAPLGSGAASPAATAEIVVTAQRRRESIQTVPITIQAFTGKTLQNLGVRNTNDLGQFTSNVTISSPAGQGNQPVITIRGIGLNDFDTNNAGPNGVYVDEVYISTPSAQSLNLFDLDRVEVLKGPQGTLYGRNTSGGAINFITAKPTDTPTGFFHVEEGSYNTVNTEAAIGGPLLSNLSGRLAATYNYSDGYFYNSFYNRRENGANNGAARGQLLWQLDADTKVLFALRGALVNNRPDEYRHIGTLDPSSGAPCSAGDALGGRCVDIFGNGTPAKFFDGAFERSEKLNLMDIAPSLRIDHRFGNIDFVSLTAFEHIKKKDPDESDATQFRILEIDLNTSSSTTSQEFRASQSTSRYNWVAGLYGSHEILRQSQIADVLLDFDDFVGPGAGDGIAQKGQGLSRQRTDTGALFGQFDYNLTRKLKLIAGGRFTAEGKGFGITQNTFLQEGGINNFGPPSTFMDHKSLSETAFSWRFGADYTLARDVLLYSSISRGFKSGGFNGGFLSTVFQEFERQLAPIKPETVTAYEVGVKSSLFDRRLTLDVAGFYNDYSNEQVFTLVPPVAGSIAPISVLDNAQRAHTEGMDASVAFAPRRELNFSANVGILRTRLDEFVATRDPSQPDYSGNQLANAPKFSATLVGEWRHALGPGLVDAQINGNFKSHQFFDAANTPILTQGSYWVANARLAYGVERQHWELALFARNLADKHYFVDAFDFTQSFGFAQGIVGAPRIVGGELNVRF